MWNIVSNAISSFGQKDRMKSVEASSECSDDDNISREEGLECPICYESFNICENVPYVLWCGHTLCKNCLLGLQSASFKFHIQQFKIPFVIFCPWCHLLSLRVNYRGNLKFPSKNFFLLWMFESINGDRGKFCSTSGDSQPIWSPKCSPGGVNQACNSHRRRTSAGYSEQSSTVTDNINIAERPHSSFFKSLDLFIHFTSKFPLVIVFLLIIFFVIPGCGFILAVYFTLTAFFAIPSFVVLYFAYPALEWLVREINS